MTPNEKRELNETFTLIFRTLSHQNKALEKMTQENPPPKDPKAVVDCISNARDEIGRLSSKIKYLQRMP